MRVYLGTQGCNMCSWLQSMAAVLWILRFSGTQYVMPSRIWLMRTAPSAAESFEGSPMLAAGGDYFMSCS